MSREKVVRMADSVRNGTTPAISLCHTCTRAHIFQGEASNERILCQATWEHPLELTEKVVRCSHYSDKRDANRPSLDAMKQMAYILSEYGPLKQVGFVPAREWRKKHGGDDTDVLPDYLPNFPTSR